MDMPALADVKINLYGDCGKKFIFDVESVGLDIFGDVVINGKHKEKRETGIEPVAGGLV